MPRYLGDVLTLKFKNTIDIEDSVSYKIAGVQNYGQGIVIRREVQGKELTMKKYQVIEKNQLMWCKVDTKNGAFGITHEGHIGSLASTNMALATINEGQIIPEFLEILFKIPQFHEHITKYSSGSTNRKYLTPKQLFEVIKIPDLSIDEQQLLIDRVHSVKYSGLFEEIHNQQNLLTKLKQSILQEAIEGKLTSEEREQNQDIEPASLLLEKIQEEKEKLIKNQKIKKSNTLSKINEDEMPFKESSSLKWCRISDLFTIEKGQTGIQKAIEGKYPLVVTAEERLSHNEYQFEGEGIIIPMVSSTGHGHASLNRIHYQEGKFAVGSILSVLQPINKEMINSKFYFTYLSLNKDELLVKKMTGAANVTLTIGALSDVIVPYISYNSQIRIKHLLDKIDNLEQQITKSKDILNLLLQSIISEAFEN